jgi:hypothetical protein
VAGGTCVVEREGEAEASRFWEVYSVLPRPLRYMGHCSDPGAEVSTTRLSDPTGHQRYVLGVVPDKDPSVPLP